MFKKKIIFFDVWLGGIKNYRKIKNLFSQNNYECKLVHTSSFNSDDNIDINADDIRDLSTYKTKFIFNVLRLEKPDYVIILNFHTLVTQIAILSCKILDIKCIFIQPGIRETDKEYIKNDEYNIKFKLLNKLRYRKFKKYFLYILPNIFYSLLFTKSQFFFISFEILKRIFLITYNPGRNLFYTSTNKIFHPDKLLVFSKLYKEHFIDIYNMKSENIHVTGNLDINFIPNLLSEYEIKIIDDILKNGRYALYCPTPFREGGYHFWSEKFFKNFIEEMILSLDKINLKLVMKLHPSMDLKYYRDLLKFYDLEIIKMDNGLNELMMNAEFSICHTSSTILNSIMHTRFTFIPRWSFFKSLNDRFSMLGLTIPINSFKEISDYYNNKKTFLLDKNNRLFRNIIGPCDDKLGTRIISHFD
jgi:hypothetical protein